MATACSPTNRGASSRGIERRNGGSMKSLVMGGGHNGNGYVATVEILYLDTLKWRTGTHLNFYIIASI